MDIYRCQREAQKSGFDSTTFKADFPAGTFDCKWLDAYMGFVRVDADGVRDGFMTVEQLDSMFPDLDCHSLSTTP